MSDHQGRGRPRVRMIALVVVCLVTAACGARWTDDQKALVSARDSANGPPATVGSDTPTGPVDQSTDEQATPAADADRGGAPSTSAPTAGQSAPSTPQGDGSGANGGEAPAAVPCTAPSDAPGVTADAIDIGSISSLSGPVPGLGSSSAAAVRAYVGYRNANGGVCGRQIRLKEADDGTDGGRYRSVVGTMANDVLAIVGGFAMGDVGAIDVLQDTALPVVNVPSSEKVTRVPTVFDLNPATYASADAGLGKFRYLHDQGVRKVAMAYLAVDQSRAEANVQRALILDPPIRVVSEGGCR